MQNIQRRFLGKTDEEITEVRTLNYQSLHPTFHPKAIALRGNLNGYSVNQILGMPVPPAVSLDEPFPWQTFGRKKGASDEESKVWVILATAPAGDAASRHFNALFNDTVGLTFPETSSNADSHTSSSPFEDLSGDDALPAATAAMSEEAAAARRKRLEDSRRQAQKYNFGVVDFEAEPTLMWSWWIWKVPAVIFVTPSTSPDRLYDLRFWKVAFMSGLTPEYMLAYIGSGSWKVDISVWGSSLAPGGRHSSLTIGFARPSNWVYDRVSGLPNWLVGLVSTALGGSLISLLHGSGSGSSSRRPQPAAQVNETPTPTTKSQKGPVKAAAGPGPEEIEARFAPVDEAIER